MKWRVVWMCLALTLLPRSEMTKSEVSITTPLEHAISTAVKTNSDSGSTASKTCLYGNLPNKNVNVSVACSFHDKNSCCSSNEYKQYLEAVNNTTSALLQQRSHRIGADSSNLFGPKCVAAFIGSMCMVCDPNSVYFVNKHNEGITISLCKNYCDKLYAACGDDWGKENEGSESFCMSLYSQFASSKIKFEISEKNQNCFNLPTLQSITATAGWIL